MYNVAKQIFSGVENKINKTYGVNINIYSTLCFKAIISYSSCIVTVADVRSMHEQIFILYSYTVRKVIQISAI